MVQAGSGGYDDDSDEDLTPEQISMRKLQQMQIAESSEEFPGDLEMPEYSMGNLDSIVTLCRDSLKKYVFIHDVSNSSRSGAASFFNYKGRLFEMHKELIQVRAMQSKSWEEACEELRK